MRGGGGGEGGAVLLGGILPSQVQGFPSYEGPAKSPIMEPRGRIAEAPWHRGRWVFPLGGRLLK